MAGIGQDLKKIYSDETRIVENASLCIVVKANSFVRFLEEFSARQFAFEIDWPLGDSVNDGCGYAVCGKSINIFLRLDLCIAF